MKTVSLVIGHTSKKTGSLNKCSGITEFSFNEKLALDVAELLHEKSNVKIIYRQSYRGLPDLINKDKPDFIVSFHANAFNTIATGTETLIYYKSKISRKFAEIMQKRIVNTLGLANRGVKGKTQKQRGGLVLKKTNAPCVMLEPFFLDNNSDLEIVQEKYDELAKCIAEGILESLDVCS